MGITCRLLLGATICIPVYIVHECLISMVRVGERAKAAVTSSLREEQARNARPATRPTAPEPVAPKAAQTLSTRQVHLVAEPDWCPGLPTTAEKMKGITGILYNGRVIRGQQRG